MRASAKRVASLYLKLASDPATLFQLLAAKNKTSFVKSVYQQFLSGKRLSPKQKEIIDEIALKAGMSPIFNASASASVLPAMSLDKTMDLDDDAVKAMKVFVKLNPFRKDVILEQPLWVKKYELKRNDVSLMSASLGWKNMYEMSFFTNDVEVLKDTERNAFFIQETKIIIAILHELIQKKIGRGLSATDLETEVSALDVLIDDLRFRDNATSVYLKNTGREGQSMIKVIIELKGKYSALLGQFKK